MLQKEFHRRICEQRLLVHKSSSQEQGTKMRQRCQECGKKFLSTRRVERCPITSGCRGGTIVLGEIHG